MLTLATGEVQEVRVNDGYTLQSPWLVWIRDAGDWLPTASIMETGRYEEETSKLGTVTILFKRSQHAEYCLT
jgi:hypothetical protein